MIQLYTCINKIWTSFLALRAPNSNKIRSQIISRNIRNGLRSISIIFVLEGRCNLEFIYQHVLSCLEWPFYPSHHPRKGLTYDEYVFLFPRPTSSFHTSLHIIAWLPLVIASPEGIQSPILIHSLFDHINCDILAMD